MQQRVNSMKGQHDKVWKVERKGMVVRENVRVREGDRWKHAKVVNTASTPRSYVVKTPDGANYQQNSKHIRNSKEPYHLFEPNIKVSGNNDP